MPELQVDIEHQVAMVTLNRPEQHNSVNFAMWRQLPALCQALDENNGVRVVVWRGAGTEAFSAGGDIIEFRNYRSNRTEAQHYNTAVQAALNALANMNKPTVALIAGYCVGGGFLLAAHCDIRIAADNAKFSLPVARLGFLITYEQMQRLVQLIGAATVTDLLLTARILNAQDAHIAGLCSQVHPLRDLNGAVEPLLRAMTHLSPLSLQWHKRMIQTVLQKPDLHQLTPAELAILDTVFDSEDYAEGVRAFIEKRSPHFTGR